MGVIAFTNKLEDWFQLYFAIFEPGYFHYISNSTGAICQSALLNQYIHRRRYLFPNGTGRKVYASHHYHYFQSTEKIAGRVSVTGGQGSVMTCVHSLQHIQCLATATLPHHNAVRSHTQSIDHQIPDADFTFALSIGRPTFQ